MKTQLSLVLLSLAGFVLSGCQSQSVTIDSESLANDPELLLGILGPPRSCVRETITDGEPSPVRSGFPQYQSLMYKSADGGVVRMMYSSGEADGEWTICGPDWGCRLVFERGLMVRCEQMSQQEAVAAEDGAKQ